MKVRFEDEAKYVCTSRYRKAYASEYRRTRPWPYAFVLEDHRKQHIFKHYRTLEVKGVR